jgi:hypothetical protein
VWLDKTTVFSYNQPGKIIPSVELFPNPADQQVNIRLNDELIKGNISIHLVDRTGRLMKQWRQQFAGKAYTINLNIAGISNGLYFIIIKDSNGKQLTEKLLIQH